MSKNGFLLLQKIAKASNFGYVSPVFNFARQFHNKGGGLIDQKINSPKLRTFLDSQSTAVSIPKFFKREKHHEPLMGGDGGQSLPIYKSIGKPFRLCVIFCLFFGVAFWAPMLLFVYMMYRG